MAVTGVFCGTFDPVTLGHMDLIERASRICDRLVVFVSPNSAKHNLFSESRRQAWLKQACAHLENVQVEIQSGLTVDAARQVGADVLIRGIRTSQDVDYEQNMAFMNHELDSHLETICLFTRPEYAYYSSSNVRELLRYHQDISRFVPACVASQLKGMDCHEDFNRLAQ